MNLDWRDLSALAFPQLQPLSIFTSWSVGILEDYPRTFSLNLVISSIWMNPVAFTFNLSNVACYFLHKLFEKGLDFSAIIIEVNVTSRLKFRIQIEIDENLSMKSWSDSSFSCLIHNCQIVWFSRHVLSFKMRDKNRKCVNGVPWMMTLVSSSFVAIDDVVVKGKVFH